MPRPVLNLMPHIQSGFGLWYVNGGMYNLAGGLQKPTEELGIAIHLNTEVMSLKKEGDRIVSALLADGTEQGADIFVSDMEVIPAYERLLNEKGPMLDSYKETFEPACSGYGPHSGVDKKYPQLAHHNFLFPVFEMGFMKYITRSACRRTRPFTLLHLPARIAHRLLKGVKT